MPDTPPPTLEAGLFALLTTAPSLAALMGARDWLYPVLLPETVALPAATFMVVGGASTPTFDELGWQRVRIQLDFFADYEQGTYDQACALREAVRPVLDGFTGTLPNGFLLANAAHIQPLGGFENDARRYRVGAEYYLYFNL
jgi:hypothetical protein